MLLCLLQFHQLFVLQDLLSSEFEDVGWKSLLNCLPEEVLIGIHDSRLLEVANLLVGYFPL